MGSSWLTCQADTRFGSWPRRLEYCYYCTWVVQGSRTSTSLHAYVRACLLVHNMTSPTSTPIGHGTKRLPLIGALLVSKTTRFWLIMVNA